MYANSAELRLRYQWDKIHKCALWRKNCRLNHGKIIRATRLKILIFSPSLSSSLSHQISTLRSSRLHVHRHTKVKFVYVLWILQCRFSLACVPKRMCGRDRSKLQRHLHFSIGISPATRALFKKNAATSSETQEAAEWDCIDLLTDMTLMHF